MAEKRERASAHSDLAATNFADLSNHSSGEISIKKVSVFASTVLILQRLTMATVRLLRLQQFPILMQLRLEEALLRATSQNWCILNDGSSTTAIVLGVSG